MIGPSAGLPDLSGPPDAPSSASSIPLQQFLHLNTTRIKLPQSAKKEPQITHLLDVTYITILRSSGIDVLPKSSNIKSID